MRQRRPAGLTAVLGIRDFRNVWLAEIISDAGSFVTFIALAVYIHDLTGETFAVGLALALRAIPWITIGPLAGVVADRVDRRALMIVCDLARAGLVTLLTFTTEPWQAYVISFASGVFAPAFRPARQALLPVIAPGEHYVRALALSEIAHQVLHTVGPALGGLAVLAVGARNAFFLDALSFLVSAAFVARVSARGRTRRPRGIGEIRRELGDGLRVLRADRLVRGLIVARAVVLFGVGDGVVALLLVYLRDRGFGAGPYGIALAAAGLGTAAGTVLLARRRAGAARAGPIVVSALAPALLALAAFGPRYGALLGILVGLGLAVSGMTLYVNTTIAERVPDALRGRLFSLTGAIFEAGDLSGSLALPAIGGVIGAAPAIALGGGTAAIVAVTLVGVLWAALRASDAERAVLSSDRAPVHDTE